MQFVPVQDVVRGAENDIPDTVGGTTLKFIATKERENLVKKSG
jgi:hypothetical protein